jgi:hypothetical protein
MLNITIKKDLMATKKSTLDGAKSGAKKNAVTKPATEKAGTKRGKSAKAK